MKKLSTKALKITLFFIFFLGIFIALYAFLYNGIKIERFGLAGTQIQGFYLRLDKKLILEIKSLNLNKIQTTPSNDFNINTQIRYAKGIHLILQYFQKIDIQKIDIQDYQANLYYDGDNFTLNLPEFYAKINLKEESSKVMIQIQDLYLKPYGIYYHGKGEYDLRRQNIQIDGNLSFVNRKSYYSYMRLNLQVQSNLRNLNIKGSSDTFADIKFLRDLLPNIENKLVESWIFDNYSVETARINEFFISIPLKSKSIIKDSLASLYVLGEAHNAEVIFNPHLPPAHAESVKLIFQNNSLEFCLLNPTYQNHRANGSQVALKEITSQNPLLQVYIKSNTTLDSEILNLLKAYEITLPLSAANAKIMADLYIGVDLDTLDLTTKGIFKSKDIEILFNGVPLVSDSLNVQLDNHLVKVETKNTRHQELLKTDSNFIIDTKTKLISGDLLVSSLLLSKESPEILQIKNQSLPFNVNFTQNEKVVFALPTFDFNVILGQNYVFNLEKLSAVVPFSQILQEYKVKEGKMQIITQDFKSYSANVSLHTGQEILRHKQDNQPIGVMDLAFNYAPEGFTLRTKDDSFILQSSAEAKRVSLKNLSLGLDLNKISANDSKDKAIPILVEGQNSNLFIKERTILADSFKITLVNGEIKASLKHKNGQADFYKRGDSVTFDLREFGDEFVNTLIQKKGFQNGRFFMNANTNAKGVLVGKITFLNVSLNEMKVLQNIMAFVDTIPSLLSLKSPGFNNQGYYVDEGVVEFGLSDEFLAIESLDFKGSSIDIKGRGIMQLESQTLNFNAELITAKSLSGIINKIPLVNYILLGKDGTIATAFKVDGTLENPQVHTQAAEDILLSPFNILKRVVTSPFEIFN
ncbi:AsmA-like C-terminal domain-containing protein [uncultured Helicobacter sp.]|uniref:YhdP family protein n=1 Tax=uncultured Helicobacter sp. TaxID=175537 RepID=UPI002609F8AF|nr:AsmA-like C-terminal domain-containing protein [uncultured Helicobacter sp.]